jgi:hypothetical protein
MSTIAHFSLSRMIRQRSPIGPWHEDVVDRLTRRVPRAACPPVLVRPGDIAWDWTLGVLS